MTTRPKLKLQIKTLEKAIKIIAARNEFIEERKKYNRMQDIQFGLYEAINDILGEIMEAHGLKDSHSADRSNDIAESMHNNTQPTEWHGQAE